MVIRVKKNKNYTTMSNYHLKDKNLSLKAKGLLSIILSLPDNWNYSIAGLTAICKESEGVISNCLKELKENNYLKVNKIKPNYNNGGRFTYEYMIFENPEECLKEQDNEIQEDKILGVEKQGLEILGVESKGLNKYTNKSNTKELNTNINNNNIYSEVIDYLNKKTDSSYKETTPVTRRLIDSRIKEGFTLTDFKKVIDNKCNEWLKDDKMKQYLRPQTLFGTKFESYLNQNVKSNEPSWWDKYKNNDFKEETTIDYDAKFKEQFGDMEE